MVTALSVALPVQFCGPLKVIFPLLVTLPLKPSNGGANESAQLVSVTIKLIPTNDGSQCAATFQTPLTSGQPAVPELPAPPDESEELELQAAHSTATAHKPRIIEL